MITENIREIMDNRIKGEVSPGTGESALTVGRGLGPHPLVLVII